MNTSLARRLDARHKIALGGLLIKAGLRDADKAFILGLILDGVERSRDPDIAARMRSKGQRVFNDDAANDRRSRSKAKEE